MLCVRAVYVLHERRQCVMQSPRGTYLCIGFRVSTFHTWVPLPTARKHIQPITITAYTCQVAGTLFTYNLHFPLFRPSGPPSIYLLVHKYVLLKVYELHVPYLHTWTPGCVAFYIHKSTEMVQVCISVGMTLHIQVYPARMYAETGAYTGLHIYV